MSKKDKIKELQKPIFSISVIPHCPHCKRVLEPSHVRSNIVVLKAPNIGQPTHGVCPHCDDYKYPIDHIYSEMASFKDYIIATVKANAEEASNDLLLEVKYDDLN